MILLTGATGLIGSTLLSRLLAAGADVRCLVRDPTRLGPNRVRVQITLGDLANPTSLRQSVRGAQTVVHLAASIRDQPGASIEELNGLGTVRLLRAAEQAGAERFIFFGAMGATVTSPARFLRSKALAQRAVLSSAIEGQVMAPSLVYAPGDAFLSLIDRFSLMPWVPISGRGSASFQPLWAEDVAACVQALLERRHGPSRLLELAGPETLSYEQIVGLALAARKRSRPLVHVPTPLVRSGLRLLEALTSSRFPTWEEAQLLDIPMISNRGAADVRSLGVEPRAMPEVLGSAEEI